MPDSIPTFYRVCFTLLDPLLAGFGVYANIFNPALVMDGWTPNPRMPPSPETTVLLYGMAGFFGMLVVLQTVLLRSRPNDVFVWQCVQGGILIQDLAMIAAFITEMRGTGRLNTNLWRGNDWANLVLYPALALLRSVFILSPTVPAGSGGRKAKRN